MSQVHCLRLQQLPCRIPRVHPDRLHALRLGRDEAAPMRPAQPRCALKHICVLYTQGTRFSTVQINAHSAVRHLQSGRQLQRRHNAPGAPSHSKQAHVARRAPTRSRSVGGRHQDERHGREDKTGVRLEAPLGHVPHAAGPARGKVCVRAVCVVARVCVGVRRLAGRVQHKRHSFALRLADQQQADVRALRHKFERQPAVRRQALKLEQVRNAHLLRCGERQLEARAALVALRRAQRGPKVRHRRLLPRFRKRQDRQRCRVRQVEPLPRHFNSVGVQRGSTAGAECRAERRSGHHGLCLVERPDAPPERVVVRLELRPVLLTAVPRPARRKQSCRSLCFGDDVQRLAAIQAASAKSSPAETVNPVPHVLRPRVSERGRAGRALGGPPVVGEDAVTGVEELFVVRGKAVLKADLPVVHNRVVVQHNRLRVEGVTRVLQTLQEHNEMRHNARRHADLDVDEPTIKPVLLLDLHEFPHAQQHRVHVPQHPTEVLSATRALHDDRAETRHAVPVRRTHPTHRRHRDELMAKVHEQIRDVPRTQPVEIVAPCRRPEGICVGVAVVAAHVVADHQLRAACLVVAEVAPTTPQRPRRHRFVHSRLFKGNQLAVVDQPRLPRHRLRHTLRLLPHTARAAQHLVLRHTLSLPPKRDDAASGASSAEPRMHAALIHRPGSEARLTPPRAHPHVPRRVGTRQQRRRRRDLLPRRSRALLRHNQHLPPPGHLPVLRRHNGNGGTQVRSALSRLAQLHAAANVQRLPPRTALASARHRARRRLAGPPRPKGGLRRRSLLRRRCLLDTSVSAAQPNRLGDALRLLDSGCQGGDERARGRCNRFEGHHAVLLDEPAAGEHRHGGGVPPDAPCHFLVGELQRAVPYLCRVRYKVREHLRERLQSFHASVELLHKLGDARCDSGGRRSVGDGGLLLLLLLRCGEPAHHVLYHRLELAPHGGGQEHVDLFHHLRRRAHPRQELQGHVRVVVAVVPQDVVLRGTETRLHQTTVVRLEGLPRLRRGADGDHRERCAEARTRGHTRLDADSAVEEILSAEGHNGRVPDGVYLTAEEHAAHLAGHPAADVIHVASDLRHRMCGACNEVQIL
eukprot:Rhum_TRINITY_DN3060_c0_g1::Rhum_TRINITY_DN3060_c0_g1_i1::g.9419::m.9419